MSQQQSTNIFFGTFDRFQSISETVFFDPLDVYYLIAYTVLVLCHQLLKKLVQKRCQEFQITSSLKQMVWDCFPRWLLGFQCAFIRKQPTIVYLN